MVCAHGDLFCACWPCDFKGVKLDGHFQVDPTKKNERVSIPSHGKGTSLKIILNQNLQMGGMNYLLDLLVPRR